MPNRFPAMECFTSGKTVLDIGCGRRKLSGSIGLDMRAMPGVDIVCDLNDRLPVADEAFDLVHADQVLEHVENLVGLVYEVHRVLRPRGLFVAHTPYFRASWAHIDPTHVRSFTVNTMDYFVRGTYCYDKYRFREEGYSAIEVFLDKDYPNSPARWLLRKLALRNPFRFENSFWSALYPFEQISYVLTK